MRKSNEEYASSELILPDVSKITNDSKLLKKNKKEDVKKDNKRDPDATKRRILHAAIAEFSTTGYGGARVEKISKKAQTNERMLYYYFNSKEELFVAVLETVFSQYNEFAKELNLNENDPITGIKTLAIFMWDYYYNHPEFIRLLNSENLYEAKHLRESSTLGNFINPLVQSFKLLLTVGEQKKIFRSNIDAVQFYLTTSALGYYILANRYTLSAVTGRDLIAKDEYEKMKHIHLDVLISYLSNMETAHNN